MTETPVKLKVTLTQAQASALHYLLKGEPLLSDLHGEVIGGLCDAKAKDRERARQEEAKAAKAPHLCGRCGKRGKIVNQCGCDPSNLPTRVQYEEVYRFTNGFARQAESLFGWLRQYGLNPTCGSLNGESVISLPVNEVETLRRLQETNPARFGNAPVTITG